MIAAAIGCWVLAALILVGFLDEMFLDGRIGRWVCNVFNRRR